MPHPGLTNQRRLSARSARQVCASYGLGKLVRFAPIAAETLNLNHLVETTRGRYFLKHHVGMRRAELEQQHRLLWVLQAAELSVGAPLADERGQSVQDDPIADGLLPTTLGWLRWLLAHRRTLAQVLDDAAHVDTSPSSTRQ